MSTYEKGKQIFDSYASDAKRHRTRELEDIAPDISKYVIEFVFGEIYAREGLSDQEKVMVTMSTLVAQGGCEQELYAHINNALNIGMDRKKIIDVFIQMIPYIGFPRVVNAVMLAKQVFDERSEI